MMSKILVTGATGQQGGSVVEALIEAGHTVRGMTRNTQSDKAKALRSHGVEVVKGDFSDSASLKAALAGVDGAFLMGTSFEAGVDMETKQGIAFVEAAKAAGLRHLVYTSVAAADKNTGIPHFESKYAVEKRVVQSGIPYTIIAPAFFYDNMMAPFVLPGLQNGVFAQALSERTPLQMVSVRNIGQLAALAFARRDDFLGKRIDLAGDSLTGKACAKAIGEASGREIGYVEVPLDQVRQMSEDMALMYEWFENVGYSADVEGLRRDYPEVKWERFSDWAKRQDWSVLKAPVPAAG
jgi:uncharacterized protein YbjT (DUF2867 family)